MTAVGGTPFSYNDFTCLCSDQVNAFCSPTLLVNLGVL